MSIANNLSIIASNERYRLSSVTGNIIIGLILLLIGLNLYKKRESPGNSDEAIKIDSL